MDEGSCWRVGKLDVDVWEMAASRRMLSGLTFGCWQLCRIVVGRWPVETSDVGGSMKGQERKTRKEQNRKVISKFQVRDVGPAG